MLADPDAQRSLLSLAQIDVAMAQAQHRRRSLPEHEKLTVQNRERLTVIDELTALDAKISDSTAEQDRIESDLEPARARLARDQKMVTDNTAGDAKALRSVLAEIDHLKGRINDLEDAELEVMDTIEGLEAERAKLAGRRTEIETGMRALIAERDRQSAEIDAELAELNNKRGGLLQHLPAELATLYERLHAKTGAAGAAELRAKRCSGCSIEIDAAQLNRYAAAPANEVLRCEECGRILVRTDQSGL